jgi:hypothetical protein
MTSEVMTKGEREELSRVVRMRAKLARSMVTERGAQLLADVEAQLSAEYASGHEAWAHIVSAAQDAVREADSRVAAICREMGIREEFRPGLSISWYGRGENADKSRRAELRKLAERRVQAAERQAKLTIDSWEAKVRTELIAGGLTSGAARAFLERMPEPEALMPPMAIAELEAALALPRDTTETEW